jgi:hypothetical protein
VSNDAAPPVELDIAGIFEGYEITVHYRGRLEQLPTVVKRLQAAGVQPSERVSPAARPKRLVLPEPWYQPDGTACCPWHQRPLKEGRYGLYCASKAEGEQANDKGYCIFALKP